MASPRVCGAVLAALLCVTSANVTSGQHAASTPELTLIGDMLVGADQLTKPGDAFRASPTGHSGVGVYVKPWPGGRIPVEFDTWVSPAQQAMIFDSCSRWSRVANVHCVPRAQEVERLFISRSGLFRGCNAGLGWRAGGGTIMNLDQGCWFDDVILHEFGHVLGLEHEHQRLDRDLYVRVNPGNLQSGTTVASAFSVIPSSPVGPYDLRSIMHYELLTFSRNGAPTLVPHPAYQTFANEMGTGLLVGGRVMPSDGDAGTLRTIYGPSPLVPSPPPSLRLAAAAGHQITIAWDPPAAGPPHTAYRIDVGADPGFLRRLSVAVDGTVTSGSGALPGGVHHLRVVPIGPSGEGAASRTLSVSLPGGDVMEPPQPPVLTAVHVSSNPITLAWTTGAGGTPTSYALLAGTATRESNLGLFPMGSNTSIATVAPPDRPLFVRIVAVNAAGSAASNEIAFEVPSSPRPDAPTMKQPVIADGTVTLAWQPAATGPTPTAFRILARSYPTDGPIAMLTATGTPLVVPGVPPGTYYVTVTALNGNARSAESNYTTVVVR